MAQVSVPTGTNQTATGVDTAISGVAQVGISVGEGFLFADFPFLATPGLKQMVQMLVNWLAGYMIRGLSTLLVFSIIDAQVGTEESSFQQALSALKAAQATGDKNAIAIALANFQIAAQNLGHSDGSVNL